jgi:hypothetical protein
MRVSRFYSALTLASLLVLGGCAVDYKRQSEEQFNLPPDLTGVCQFQWSAGKANYRIANFNGFGWTRPSYREHPALESQLGGLFSECRHVPEMATAKATVSSHYLEYTDKDRQKQSPLSMGVMNVTNRYTDTPQEGKSYYVACVETATPGGPRRAALAQGVIDAKLTSRSNRWPAINNSVRQFDEDRLLGELTQQAWHKLWTVGQGLPAGVGCQNTLDALVN